MSHGLALDHAAWSSPWRTRSLRDKAILSGGLLVGALVLPPVPGGVAVGIVSLLLLVGPIRVGAGKLARIAAIPLVSILIGVVSVAISVSIDGGLRVQVTDAGVATAATILVRSVAATLAMFTLACSTPMIDLLGGLRRLRVPDALIEIAALILVTLTVTMHFAFIAYLVTGGFVALRLRRTLPLHVAAVVWGLGSTLLGWPCPLTSLERWARARIASGWATCRRPTSARTWEAG